MEFTVEFRKFSIELGSEIIHETTIKDELTKENETSIKREATKIAKTLEPFKQLQTECPMPWDSYGYGRNETFSKKWSPYTQNYPLSDNATYSITIIRSAAKFDTVLKKLNTAKSKVTEAYEELTNKTHAYDPDTTKLDPEIQDIVGIDLPKHAQALLELINGAQKRLQLKIEKLNSNK